MEMHIGMNAVHVGLQVNTAQDTRVIMDMQTCKWSSPEDWVLAHKNCSIKNPEGL